MANISMKGCGYGTMNGYGCLPLKNVTLGYEVMFDPGLYGPTGSYGDNQEYVQKQFLLALTTDIEGRAKVLKDPYEIQDAILKLDQAEEMFKTSWGKKFNSYVYNKARDGYAVPKRIEDLKRLKAQLIVTAKEQGALETADAAAMLENFVKGYNNFLNTLTPANYLQAESKSSVFQTDINNHLRMMDYNTRNSAPILKLEQQLNAKHNELQRRIGKIKVAMAAKEAEETGEAPAPITTSRIETGRSTQAEIDWTTMRTSAITDAVRKVNNMTAQMRSYLSLPPEQMETNARNLLAEYQGYNTGLQLGVKFSMEYKQAQASFIAALDEVNALLETPIKKGGAMGLLLTAGAIGVGALMLAT